MSISLIEIGIQALKGTELRLNICESNVTIHIKWNEKKGKISFNLFRFCVYQLFFDFKCIPLLSVEAQSEFYLQMISEEQNIDACLNVQILSPSAWHDWAQ